MSAYELTAEAKRRIKEDQPDFLCLNFANPDMVGHTGDFAAVIKAVETVDGCAQDVIETLLEEDYQIFLTADHGAVHVPNYLKDHKIPAGYIDIKQLKQRINQELFEQTGVEDLVSHIGNDQVYFDKDLIHNYKLNYGDLQVQARKTLLTIPGVDKVYTPQEIVISNSTEKLHSLLLHGLHPRRSGDLLLVLQPGHVDYKPTGSTHGSGFSYDTHAPLLMMGHGIRNTQTYKPTKIVDIAPTISRILGIAYPNGSTGQVIEEALVKAGK